MRLEIYGAVCHLKASLPTVLAAPPCSLASSSTDRRISYEPVGQSLTSFRKLVGMLANTELINVGSSVRTPREDAIAGVQVIVGDRARHRV